MPTFVLAPHKITRPMPALPHFRWAWWLGLLGALIALRLVVWLVSGAGLHVDEAQYWIWSQQLQWGYYSKPPGIAVLIAVSTALLGDGLIGVRWLAALCWLGSGFLVAGTAWYVTTRTATHHPDAGKCPDPAHVAALSALIFFASPAPTWLGLVATTDAPLMLAWSAAMLGTAMAILSPNPRKQWLAWGATGLLLGLGLLGKYTMALLPVGWAILLPCTPRGRQRRQALAGAALAGAIGLLMFAPHLVWNAQQGWPTVDHVAHITLHTANAAPAPGGLAALVLDAAARWLAYLAGAMVILGPVGLWALGGTFRHRRPQAVASAPSRERPSPARFAIAFVLPLLLVGALLSLRKATQLNWVVAVLPGLCIWLAWTIAARWHGAEQAQVAIRRWATAALACLALFTGMASTDDVRRFVPFASQHPSATQWDLWGRMRGWEPALTAMAPARERHPDWAILSDSRSLLAHAGYVWRRTADGVDPPRPTWSLLRGWRAPGRPASNHFALQQALGKVPGEAREGLWLLSEGQPDPALLSSFASAQPVATARSGKLRLELWALRPGDHALDGAKPRVP